MVFGIGSAIKREAKRAVRKVRKEVKRTGRRIEKEVGRSAEDVISLPKTATEKTVQAGAEVLGEVGEALSPDINIPTPEDPTPIPMPDEELARVARRRSMAKRRRGRSASILTGADTLG